MRFYKNRRLHDPTVPRPGDRCHWALVGFADLTQERVITTSLERAGGERLKTTDVPCNRQVARLTLRVWWRAVGSPQPIWADSRANSRVASNKDAAPVISPVPHINLG